MRVIFLCLINLGHSPLQESDLLAAILDSIDHEAMRKKAFFFVIEAPTAGGGTLPWIRCTYVRHRIDDRTQESLRKANQPRSLNRRPLVSFSLNLPLAAPGEFRG